MTLLDRNKSIVTDEEDRKLEAGWTINSKRDPNPNLFPLRQKIPLRETPCRHPYFEGFSERVARLFRKHGFSTAMKPHRTLRSMLVHPKDTPLPHQEKVRPSTKYLVPIAPIGETGRSFGTHLQV